MSEINCFIDVNNSTMNFMITMDADVNWKMFNEEVSKYVASINPSNLKFSYIDEVGDKISFGSDVELKEAFEYALSLGEGNIFVIFAETNNVSAPVESIPSNNNEVKEELKKPFNPLLNIIQNVLKDQKPNQWEQFMSSIIDQSSIKPENVFEEVNNVIHKVFTDENLQNDIQQIANKFVPGLEINFLRPQSPAPSSPSPSPVNNNNNNNNNKANTRVHFAFCDHCKKRIEGIRYKCLQCPDYDFCEVCEELNQKEKLHDENHIFAKLYKPLPAPFRSLFNQNQHQHHPRSPRCHRPFHHMFHQMNNSAEQNNNNNTNNNTNNEKNCNNKGHLARDCPISNNNINNNNDEKKAPRCPIFANIARGNCHFVGHPVVKLEEKVSQLEKQLEEIKSLVAAKKEQSPQQQSSVDLSSSPVPIPQPSYLPFQAIPNNEPVNVPVDINNNNNNNNSDNDVQAVISLSPQEEECYKQLKEMGFDIHTSIISENNADLALILEKLM